MSRVRKTIDLSEKEGAVLAQLAVANDMTEMQIIRQALKLYQLVDSRVKAGEQMSFSGDPQRIIEFVGMF